MRTLVLALLCTPALAAPTIQTYELTCSRQADASVVAVVKYFLVDGDLSPLGSIRVLPSTTFTETRVILEGVTLHFEWGASRILSRPGYAVLRENGNDVRLSCSESTWA